MVISLFYRYKEIGAQRGYVICLQTHKCYVAQLSELRSVLTSKPMCRVFFTVLMILSNFMDVEHLKILNYETKVKIGKYVAFIHAQF